MSYMYVSLKANHCFYSPGNETRMLAYFSYKPPPLAIIGMTKFNDQFQKRNIFIVAWILREDISVGSCYQDYRYSESLPNSDLDWKHLGLLHVHISLTQDVTNHILLLLKLKDLVHIFKYQKK